MSTTVRSTATSSACGASSARSTRSSTRSKHSMASVTATAKPERARHEADRRWRWPGSRLGRLIVALNLLGLAVLIVGALVLNEVRHQLVLAEIDSLTTQGRGIVHLIEQTSTNETPALDGEV